MKKYLRFDLFSSFFFFFPRRIGIDGLGVQVLDLGCCIEYELQVFFFLLFVLRIEFQYIIHFAFYSIVNYILMT
jgi:hypothetical protein